MLLLVDNGSVFTKDIANTLSNSDVKFEKKTFDEINPEQIKMVTDYLEIDYWERAMKVNPQDTKWVKEIMEQATI